MDIYKNLLLNHYHNPINKGKIENCNFDSEILNPSCGDKIAIQAIIEDNIVKKIAFEGSGCIISQATASILVEFCQNKSFEFISKISSEDITKLIGTDLGPTRLKCALLPLKALFMGIENYILFRK